jgi:hypothetical protein
MRVRRSSDTKSDVWYVGYAVGRPREMLEGKRGVFQERYQPHFTDWIGACGEKEIQIVENLWELQFDRSQHRCERVRTDCRGTVLPYV